MKVDVKTTTPAPAVVRGGKPTLGYPSRTDAVLGLLGEGKSPAAVAAELGVKRGTIYGLVSKAGLRRCEDGSTRRSHPSHALGDPGGRPSSKVELNYDVVRLLRPFAARRATTVPQIARELVEAALDRGLIGTLLDGRF